MIVISTIVNVKFVLGGTVINERMGLVVMLCALAFSYVLKHLIYDTEFRNCFLTNQMLNNVFFKSIVVVSSSFFSLPGFSIDRQYYVRITRL